MAKKENVGFSVAQFKRVAKENFENVKTFDWYGETITIRETIDFSGAITFVNTIAESCFTEDGEYRPEVFDFMVRSRTLVQYAGFNMPDDIDEHYSLLYETDAFDVVLQQIDRHQFEDLVKAASRKVQYLCETNTKRIEQQMQEMLDNFQNVGNLVQQTFQDVDPEDLGKMVESVGDNGIRPDMLVEAYMDTLKKRKMETYTGPVEEVTAV